MNAKRKMASVAVATAAAAMFAAGMVSTATHAQEVKVKCYGSNACKGKGFEEMSEKACVEKLGRA